MSNSSLKEIKELAWQSNMDLVRKGLVIETFGNASALDRARGIFAIKPSGVPYAELKARDMVVVDLENRIVEGKLRPSSDTKTHCVLYRHFADIGGVVHTHSPFAVAWAQAMRAIPILGTTHADHLQSSIPCTHVMSDDLIAGDYEEATGLQIVRTFASLSYKEIEMVLLACHGPFTWGATPQKAVYNSVMLEELAKMALYTLAINPDTPSLNQPLIDKHYQRKHGTGAYYGQG